MDETLVGYIDSAGKSHLNPPHKELPNLSRNTVGGFVTISHT